jgi:hypothetical protein
MKTALRVEGEITKDGHLLVELPAQLPRGPVLVTLEPMAEEDFALKEEDLKGAGLTADEIALSPEIGAWSEEPEMPTTENSVGEGLWQR